MSNVVLSNNLNTKKNYAPIYGKKRKNIVVDKTPEDKLNRIYRSQGYIGKFFDNIQGFLNIGYS